MQSLTARGQNANEEGTPVDEFDYDSDESDVGLDHSDLHEDSGDIDTSNEVDPDQSNVDDGLDLDERDSFSWGEDLKPVEINLFTKHVGPKTEDLELIHESRPLEFLYIFFSRDLVETRTTIQICMPHSDVQQNSSQSQLSK